MQRSAAQRGGVALCVAFSVCSTIACDSALPSSRSCCPVVLLRLCGGAALLNLLDKVRRRRTRARVFVERRVERHEVRHVCDVHACDRRQSFGVSGRNDMER
jgi:hypothetical protein